MTDIYLKLENNEWVECEKENAHQDAEGEYFMLNSLLIERLKRIEKNIKDNWDAVILVDGRERSGKSTLGMLIGEYLTRGKLSIQNFSKGLEDAKKKIRELPDKSILIMDEGSTIFSSKDSTSKAQKELIKIMDVVGQKNMVFIVILPCFFDLNKTIAVRRSLFLCHVQARELKERWYREPFYYYGEKTKGKLYRIGKKNYDSYNFPLPNFKGNFHKWKPHFWDEYEKEIKRETLNELLSTKESKERTRARDIEALYCGYLSEELGATQKQIAKIRNLSRPSISELLTHYKKLKEENKLPLSNYKRNSPKNLQNRMFSDDVAQKGEEEEIEKL